MARFVARYGKYSHGVQTGRDMVLQDGQRAEIVRHIQANFTPAAGNSCARTRSSPASRT